MKKNYKEKIIRLRENKINVFVIFLLLLSFFLRILYLSSNPIGLDEPFSIFHAQMSVNEIIKNLSGGNNPPLYEIILHFWIKLFGIEPCSVRFPSLIFSVINVFFVFLIANKFFNLRIALLATSLIIFSSYHLYFSHEARVYSLFALLTTISFYLIIQLLSNGISNRGLVCLFLTYVTLVFSHYFGIYVVLLQLIILIFFGFNKREDLKKYFVVIIGLVIIYSFFIPEFFSRLIDSTKNGTWLRPVENLGNLHDLVFSFTNKDKLTYLIFIFLIWGASWKFIYELNMNKYIRILFLLGVIPIFFLTSYSIFLKIPFIWKLTSLRFYTFIFILTILSFILIVVFKKKNEIPINLIIVIWFIVPLLMFFAISFYVPVFLDRYLIFILPSFYILTAISANYIFKKISFYFVSFIIVLLMIFSFDINNSQNIGIEKTVNRIKKLKNDSTKVIICPNQFKLTFLYHYNKNFFSDYNNVLLNLKKDNIFPVYNSSELDSIIYHEDSHIIFLDAHSKFLYPDNGVYNKLEKLYDVIDRFEDEDPLVIYNLKRLQIK